MVLISSVRFLVLSHEGRSWANPLNENTRRLPKAPFFLQKGFLSVRENTEHYVVLRSNIW